MADTPFTYGFPHESTRPVALRFEVVTLVACLAAVKIAWLVADHTLRAYMGDSMVFLHSAAHLGGIGGRSFMYGWTLHFLAQPFGSPWAYLILQAVWGVLSCVALYLFLRGPLALGRWLSATPALLLASDPAQLFMERMVMAEALGLLAFVTTLLVLSRYIATRHLGWYVLACLGGLAAANFRTNLLPVMLGLGVLAPFLASMSSGTFDATRRNAAQAACALAILAASHLAYTHIYGYVTRSDPGYLTHTGMMRIGLVAPLVQAHHFEGTGVDADILEEVALPLRDHWQRGHHIWSEDGLWEALRRNSDQPETVARIITRRAMLDNPMGLLRINLETLGGYFNENQVHWRMLDDKGVIAPTEQNHADIESWMGWSLRGVDALETPVRRYFANAAGWLTLCLFALAPLAMLTALLAYRHPRRAPFFLLSLASLGLVASHILFAHIVSFRYLHPYAWFVAANMCAIIGLGLGALQRHRAPSHAGTPGLSPPGAHGSLRPAQDPPAATIPR